MRELDRLLASELFDLCPDPIIGVDRRGTINLFNAAAEKLLGYRADEIIGQFDAVGLYGDAAAARAIKSRLWREHHHQRQLRGWETELKSATGDVIPIRLSATLVMQAIDTGEALGDRRALRIVQPSTFS
jgi:PAS domain S-box-containing protein